MEPINLHQINNPNNPNNLNQFNLNLLSSQHPIWAMAFRPFYLLAAIYGALSILLWGFGYTGTRFLPVHFWHAHEMIWGYTGAIVVAFLLTAVATWTSQPPTRGKPLMILVILWLIARISVFLSHWEWAIDLSYVSGTLFYWFAAYCMGISVFKTQNKRNYIAVFALFLFGLTHALFHAYLKPFNPIALINGLHAGLIMIAGFIGLIGNRIISFFTSRRLNTPQFASPQKLVQAALYFPLIAVFFKIFNILFNLSFFNYLAYLLIFSSGLISLWHSSKWFEKGILNEPMLWILHAGYLATGLGLTAFGLGILFPTFNSLGIHLIAVGGIGLLTLGMMTRTALGHTARPLYPAPKGLNLAFWLMIFAAFFRTLAALLITVNTTAYTHSYRLSAVLFALALLIYFWRYAPWLTQPRLDGKAG